MHVLVVEDEKSLAKELQVFLTKEHFLVDVANNGRTASEKIAVNAYDFVLLDLTLPDYEGIDLLKEAKKVKQEAAFIIITARGEVNDKIKGLDLGADDYLAKPFSLFELLSRMKAITRRKYGLKNEFFQLKDFVIDQTNRKLLFGETEIILTKKEYDILNYLSLHKNRVLTRIQITEHIWGNVLEEDYDSNYIDVHIKNLRKKLGAYSSVDWLETVRGIGYRLNVFE
jgi:DNA-binding response OmpR family regulator